MFWFTHRDAALVWVPLLGALASILGAAGAINTTVAFALNLIAYHSLDPVFEGGLRYPWEKLTFELGYVSLFAPTLLPVSDSLGVVEGTTSALVLASYRWIFSA